MSRLTLDLIRTLDKKNVKCVPKKSSLCDLSLVFFLGYPENNENKQTFDLTEKLELRENLVKR